MDSRRENEIIELVLEGNREAYAELVEEYKGAIFNLAFSMTGNYGDAGDLTQDAFLKAYNSLGMFKQGKRFFPWLYTIAINQVRNYLKRRKRIVYEDFSTLERESPNDDSDNPEESMVRREEASIVNAELARLPVKLREAIVLRYMNELGFEDIAAILGTSLSGAKMRVYRGLEKMRKNMEKKSG